MKKQIEKMKRMAMSFCRFAGGFISYSFVMWYWNGMVVMTMVILIGVLAAFAGETVEWGVSQWTGQ